MRVVVVCLAAALCAALPTSASPCPAEPDTIDIAPVWSGHPVGFALLTAGKRQFVAYYDDQRRMTVAARTIPSTEWHKVVLHETLGWDSHNYVTMAADRTGCLHLSGNMHVRPLVYFRTARPWDIDTFERVSPMVGPNEQRCTYPEFLEGARGQLLFTYRDGASGSGDQIWNAYDPAAHTWRRLLDRPLTAGGGKMNAYFHGPVRGPDGWFHLCWVWRNTPDCATNHDLSYARSRDMVHWESAAGKPLTLPITVQTADIVDPVPPGGGMLNGNTKIGFDTRKRAVIAYHKFDADGNSQIYNARFEGGKWVNHLASDWHYRWEFKGGGSIVAEIGLSGVRPDGMGRLVQTYWHAKLGSGGWLLDPDTLAPLGPLPPAPPKRAAPQPAASGYPGMEWRSAGDLGKSPERGVRYILRWETLPANRDRAREGTPPPPTMLRLVRVREADAN